MLLSILFLVVGVYTVNALAVAWGIVRTRRRPVPEAPDPWPLVSVVVAARNEEATITTCLESLLACSYPADRLEILVVDDFSTDRTAARVRATQRAAQRTPVSAGPARASDAEDDGPRIRLLQMADVMPDNGGHKSEAVARGVDAARGTVILTTDADCTVAPGWLRSMVRRCTPQTPFVAGPVQYAVSHRWFDRLQALEFTGLIAYGAGTLGLGVPTFCNSANVAVRRDVLKDLPNVPEGAARDEMLLQHVAYNTNRDVVFNPDADALVTTEPASHLRTYLQQQARWASMGTRYPYVLPRGLVLLLWVVHTALLAGVGAALFVPVWQQPVLAAFLVKFAADAVFTVPLVKHFGQEELLRSSVATEWLLLWAVPLVGVLGFLAPVEWKGRTLE